jgi:hypothetical protein
MPRRALALLPLAATLCLATAAPAQQGARMSERFVVTERDAVLMLPPQLVATGNVTQTEWSPTGRYVLAVRNAFQFPVRPGEGPPFDAALVLWDREKQQSRDLWRSRQPGELHAPISWLARQDVALVTVTEWVQPPAPRGEGAPPTPPPTPQRLLLRLDARAGQLRTLLRLDDDALVLAAPLAPLFAVQNLGSGSVALFRADGRPGLAVQLPHDEKAMRVYWPQDGKTLIVQTQTPPEPGKAPPAYAVDPLSGKVTSLPKPPPAYVPITTEEPVLRLKEGAALLRESETATRVRPLWLEVAAPGPRAARTGSGPLPVRALVAPDSEWSALSPGGDAVLYLAEGSAWVAPLLPLPKETFIMAREAATRTTRISNAKQVALGLLMYAQDHDETLPGSQDPISDLIMPYTKTDAIFDGLVYTFSGGPLSAVAEPSKTELGYIPGPGGIARLFVDGHVEWKKN